MSKIVLQVEQLAKRYQEGGSNLTIFENLALQLDEGEFVAVVGPSGCGKSTLLNLLGGLDRPSAGTVTLKGAALASLSEKKLCQWRNAHLGFIYQFHHLLPEFSALENVLMPLLIRGDRASDARDRARALLTQVGLGNRLSHKPGMLSGGERQRVAIARALVTEPALVLADEPTGNLDERTADSIQELMLSLNESYRTAFLIVTHDMAFASRCQKKYQLHEGRLDPVL